MLQNNLHPELDEHPGKLIVYGSSGEAARVWVSLDEIVVAVRLHVLIPIREGSASQERP